MKNKFLLYILLTMSFSSCNSQSVQWREYNGSAFSISSPISWERSKTPDGNTFVFKTKKESLSDTFQENFNVIVQDLGVKGMLLKDYSELTYSQVKQALGEKAILDFKEVSLSSKESKEMSYIISKNPSAQQYIDLRVRQRWVIKENKAYLLTYTAQKENYEKYNKIAEKMFDSFKLK